MIQRVGETEECHAYWEGGETEGAIATEGSREIAGCVIQRVGYS